MKKFDLSGTLMYKDVELAEFKIEGGYPVEFKQLSFNSKNFPFEMEIHQNGNTLINTLLDRIVPETRQGLLDDLRKVGIVGYDISAILRYQNATSLHDYFWVRFDDGPQTWKQLRDKIGWTTY